MQKAVRPTAPPAAVVAQGRAAEARWWVAHYANPPQWVWMFTGPRPGWRRW